MGKNHIITLLNKASETVKKKKKISIPRLAVELGYRSPEYFKRSQLPLILEMLDCIGIEGNYVIWKCENTSKKAVEVVA